MDGDRVPTSRMYMQLYLTGLKMTVWNELWRLILLKYLTRWLILADLGYPISLEVLMNCRSNEIADLDDIERQWTYEDSKAGCSVRVQRGQV